MSDDDLGWIAPREGHDWQDQDLLLAVAWLKALVPQRDLERRLDSAKALMVERWSQMREGWPLPLYDPADIAAWYILQADTTAIGREFWAPTGGPQVIPYAPSPYSEQERARGEILARPVHDLALNAGESIVVQVAYHVELAAVPVDYLEGPVRAALQHGMSWRWVDEVGMGEVSPVDWDLARGVLEHNSIYFGGSRMIELLSGGYIHEADHSLFAKWRPDHRRPSYADAVYHASVVSWLSESGAAAAAKAKHFRRTLAQAEGQLPSDRPGVVHIGIETRGDRRVDFRRHLINTLEARTFDTSSRLRWVYCNYFVPEATTRQDEIWAITETVAPYQVGTHSTKWPLPGHMILSPEGETRPGVHWDPDSTW